jgi:NAD(P)-dependent dehydrogenase (short-subunit alcohol dehydrogenase family)
MADVLNPSTWATVDEPADDADMDLLSEPVDDSDVIDAEADIDLRTSGSEDSRESVSRAERDPFAPLVGKVAVVTGAHDPVGRSVALAFLAAGARVCVIGRDAAALHDLAREAGPRAPVVSLQCDLGSAAEVASAADFVTRVDRPVDVLVHCADVHVRNSLTGGPVEDLDEQYLVNLRGPYLLTQALVDPIRSAGGHVVFVNPVDDATFTSSDTQYAMTRYGVRALASGVREELDDANVRVTTVHVGGDIQPDASGAALHPDDVADCVLGAVEMPPHIEITDLHVRPRTVL